LKINNAVEATGEITLAGGASLTIPFTIRKDVAGTYTVDINGLSGTFEVKGEPSATPPTEPATEPPASPTTPPDKTNWGLIGVIIAATVVGVTVPLVLRRRRKES